MNDRSLLNSQAGQEAIFEAIKAKHQNLHACLSKKSDPLLLELADMILLFSAQLALLGGAPLHREALPKEGRVLNPQPQPATRLS